MLISSLFIIITFGNAHLPGIILTLVMCKNMNRSMSKVLVGGFGSAGGSVTKKKTDAVGTVKQVLAEDVVEMMTQSKKIIIVPGYGMVSCSWLLLHCFNIQSSILTYIFTHRRLQKLNMPLLSWQLGSEH